MTQKQTIAMFAVLCLIALGLGYWVGQPEKAPAQNTQAAPPMITTNVVTNVVGVQPKPKPIPVAINQPVKPKPKPPNIVPAIEWNPIVEKAIRKSLNKPTGKLTKADLEKVTVLNLGDNQLTDVKGLEKLTHLSYLSLDNNQLTEVPKRLENLTQLTYLSLYNNPDLTKAQIAELQKALPKCRIGHPFAK